MTKFKIGNKVFSYSLQKWGRVIDTNYEMHFVS